MHAWSAGRLLPCHTHVTHATRENVAFLKAKSESNCWTREWRDPRCTAVSQKRSKGKKQKSCCRCVFQNFFCDESFLRPCTLLRTGWWVQPLASTVHAIYMRRALNLLSCFFLSPFAAASTSPSPPPSPPPPSPPPSPPPPSPPYWEVDPLYKFEWETDPFGYHLAPAGANECGSSASLDPATSGLPLRHASLPLCALRCRCQPCQMSPDRHPPLQTLATRPGPAYALAQSSHLRRRPAKLRATRTSRTKLWMYGEDGHGRLDGALEGHEHHVHWRCQLPARVHRAARRVRALRRHPAHHRYARHASEGDSGHLRRDAKRRRPHPGHRLVVQIWQHHCGGVGLQYCRLRRALLRPEPPGRLLGQHRLSEPGRGLLLHECAARRLRSRTPPSRGAALCPACSPARAAQCMPSIESFATLLRVCVTG